MKKITPQSAAHQNRPAEQAEQHQDSTPDSRPIVIVMEGHAYAMDRQAFFELLAEIEGLTD